MKFYLNLPLGRHDERYFTHLAFLFALDFSTHPPCFDFGKNLSYFTGKVPKILITLPEENTFLAIILKISCNNCIP